MNRKNVLYRTSKMFLELGYRETTIKKICAECDINIGTFFNLFDGKEFVMREIVKYVSDIQFEKTEKFTEGFPRDGILTYAAETTLQLYMAEASESIRELYFVAYSLPSVTESIRETVAAKTELLFKNRLPGLTERDFYMLEISAGGIMRGFLEKKCDMWFTVEEKIKRFLTDILRVYTVSEEKISEAIEFVSQFDYKTLARETINSMLGEIGKRLAIDE